MTTYRLPFEIKNALIEVCGRSFWYKQPLFDLFARAGIPEERYLKYEHEPKFKMARQLIDDLEGIGEEGLLLQRRLVTELCKLRTLPDSEVPDKDAGLSALRKLKELAVEQKIVFEEEKQQTQRTIIDAEARVQKARERDRRLAELHDAFSSMLVSSDHNAGYLLERLCRFLLAVHR